MVAGSRGGGARGEAPERVVSVFLCYSHADELHRVELLKHFSGLLRRGVIEAWHDRLIVAGDHIDEQIEERLDSADIVLLLVSPDFLASDYCYEVELRRAMQRHQEGTARVIPVIVRRCDWKRTPFGRLNAVPRDGTPVTSFDDRDEAYLEIVNAIGNTISVMGRPRLERTVVTHHYGPIPGTLTVPQSSDLRIGGMVTDAMREAFLGEAFEFVARYFENSVMALQARYPGSVEYIFKPIDLVSFEVTVFVGGRRRSHCGIWLSTGGQVGMGSGIYFSVRGVGNRTGFNEALRAVDEADELLLSPLIGMWDARSKRLNKEAAAEYLWQNFKGPLEHV